jgi:LacI family fructose operon transcriptional repressor
MPKQLRLNAFTMATPDHLSPGLWRQRRCAWARQRISPEMAERVEETARRLGYRVNRQARGLRLSRSGLAGMLIPHYRNRFFAGLAECFEEQARSLGLCPIVVSTQRSEDTQSRFVRTLLDQRVEFLFFAGMNDPARLNLACRDAETPCINLDTPGREAPSVVTNNRDAARQLTSSLIRQGGVRADRLLFLGGIEGEFATEGRILGFREATLEAVPDNPPDRILRCGHSPESTMAALTRIIASPGTIPSGVFVNSITALEGLLQFRSAMPDLLPLGVLTGALTGSARRPFAGKHNDDASRRRPDDSGSVPASARIACRAGPRHRRSRGLCPVRTGVSARPAPEAGCLARRDRLAVARALRRPTGLGRYRDHLYAVIPDIGCESAPKWGSCAFLVHVFAVS